MLVRFAFLAAVAALPLAACQDTGLAVLPGRGGASAAGFPIAFESLEGAPDAIRASFAAALAEEARARRIELVGAGSPARYRLRGYLAATPAETGASFAYVWDLFDSGARRAQRLNGATPLRLPAGQTDAWTGVDAATLKLAATGSLEAIGRFLAEGAEEPPAIARSTPETVEPEQAAIPVSYAPRETAAVAPF